MYPHYFSKANYSFNDSKQVGWHYIAITKLSPLLREITSAHNGGFIV